VTNTCVSLLDDLSESLIMFFTSRFGDFGLIQNFWRNVVAKFLLNFFSGNWLNSSGKTIYFVLESQEKVGSNEFCRGNTEKY